VSRSKEELSKYERINLEAARVMVFVSAIGNEMEEKPEYESIRENWDEYVEGVIAKLGDIGDETVSFGEAYDT
jgi:hypothetical protein